MAPPPYRKGLGGCGAPRKAGLALEAREVGQASHVAECQATGEGEQGAGSGPG